MKLLATVILGISWFTFVYLMDKRFRIVPKVIHFVLFGAIIVLGLTFVLPLIFGLAGISIAESIIHLISQRMEFFIIGFILLLPFPASLINRVQKRRNLVTSLVVICFGAFCFSWVFYALYDFYGSK